MGEFSCTFLELILPYIIRDLGLENNSASVRAKQEEKIIAEDTEIRFAMFIILSLSWTVSTPSPPP